MSKKIIFSAGGTGGHILPAINLMQHFFDKKYAADKPEIPEPITAIFI